MVCRALQNAEKLREHFGELLPSTNYLQYSHLKWYGVIGVLQHCYPALFKLLDEVKQCFYFIEVKRKVRFDCYHYHYSI